MISINQKISVIVPAFNEEKNIAKVLSVLDKISWLDEIIVVNDCSDDKTEKEIKKFKNIKFISHKKNTGKGGAIASGVKVAKNDLLLFIDADLIGLSEFHILKILSPLCFTCEADLSLGIFGKGEVSGTNFANRAFPAITGQRAIWKKDMPPLSEISDKRYGVDLIITKRIPKEKRAVVKLHGLSQVVKEDKTDKPMEGVKSRIKMYKEIIQTIRDEKKRHF